MSIFFLIFLYFIQKRPHSRVEMGLKKIQLVLVAMESAARTGSVHKIEKSTCIRKCFFLARPRGFEPLTYRFVAGHSIR